MTYSKVVIAAEISQQSHLPFFVSA